MKLELEKIIDKYFKENTEIIYYGDTELNIDNVIKNIGIYEKPDILSIYDDKIILIEHFEFDSFTRTIKGSNYKINNANIIKNLNEEEKIELLHNKSLIIKDNMDYSASFDNYVNNFIKIFKDHYSKIDSYIINLDNDFDINNKELHICFFVDDVSPLGSYFLDRNNNIMPLLPVHSKKIINLLRESNKIEYLIMGTFYMNENKLIIIKNDEETLNKFEELKITKDDFFCFKPNLNGYSIKIIKN